MPWIVVLLDFLDSLMAFLIFLTLLALLREHRTHPVDQSLSPDGKWRLVLQTIGPRAAHGPQRCRISLYQMNRRRAKYNFTLPQGEALTSRSWSVSWMEDEGLVELPAITADPIVFLLEKPFACGVLPVGPMPDAEKAAQQQLAGYRAIYHQAFRMSGCNFLPLYADGKLTSVQLSLTGQPLEVLYYREDAADGRCCLFEHLQLDADHKLLHQKNRFVYDYASGLVTALGAEAPAAPEPAAPAQDEPAPAVL